jgi:hypothetical protein
VLNCLAITFIVELDEDLNHRDPIEVNDLVIQSLKKYLINSLKKPKTEYSLFEAIVTTFLSVLLFDDFIEYTHGTSMIHKSESIRTLIAILKVCLMMLDELKKMVFNLGKSLLLIGKLWFE